MIHVLQHKTEYPTMIYESAVSYLYETHISKIKNHVRRFASNQNNIEDLAHSAFLKILDKIPSLREPSYLETWIFKITQNEARMDNRKDFERRRDSQEPTDFMYQKTSGAVPNMVTPSTILTKRQHEILEKTLSSLPVRTQRCIRLHIMNDLSYEELIQALTREQEQSPKAEMLRTIVRRGLLALREKLEAQGFEI